MDNRVFQDEINASAATAEKKKRGSRIRGINDNWASVYVENRIVNERGNRVLVETFDDWVNLNRPVLSDAEDPSDFKYMQAGFEQKKSAFVPLYEKVFEDTKGQVPLDFYLQFDEHTLRSFAQLLSGDQQIQLESMWEAERRERAYQRIVDEEVEKRMDAANEGGLFRVPENIVKGMVSFAYSNAPDQAKWQLSEAEKQRIRDRVERELAATEDTDDGFWSSINRGSAPFLFGLYGAWNFAQGRSATETLGYTIEKAAAAAPALRWVSDVGGPYTAPIGMFLDWQLQRLEEQRSADLKEIELAEGYASVYASQRVWEDAERDWEALPEEEKEVYRAITDGDDIKAMGLFAGQREEAEDQFERYEEEFTSEAQEGLKVMREAEYTDKDALLGGLAWWGNLTGDFAVASLLLLNPTESLSNGFDGYMEAIREADHSPAQLMGWDGSVLGIAFDFGMMAMFDPTTYMFGGGAATAAGRGVVRSQKGVLRMLKSPELLAKVDDIERMVLSPSTGHAASLSAAGLDSYGMLQLMNISELHNPVFANKAWKVAQPQAAEGLTEWVARLLPKGTSGKQAAKAIKKRKGFTKPITIQVGTSRTWKLADGDAAALAASVDEGWGTVPMVFEYVDDGFKAYTKENIEQMVHVSKNLPKPKLNALTSEAGRGGTLEEIARHVRPNDKVLGTFDRGGHTYTVKKTNTTVSGDFAPTQTTGIRGLIPSAETGGAAARLGTRDFKELWYVVDESGDVVGGYNGYELVRRLGDDAASDPLAGLMHDVLKVSEDANDSFLPRLMERSQNDPDFTKNAVSFLDRALKERLGNRLGTESIDDALGASVRDLDGLSFGLHSPHSIYDEGALLGGTSLNQQIQNIYKGQLMRNGRLEDMTYTAVARGMMGLVRKVSGMTDDAFTDYVQRFFTQRNLSRTFNTSSEFAVDDVFDYMMRMFGDDTELLDEFTNRLVNTVRQAKNKQPGFVSQQKRILELEQRYETLAKQVGKMPDNFDELVESGVLDADAAADLRADLSAFHDLERDIEKLRDEAAKARAQLPDNTDLYKVLDDAIDAYNRKYLATMDEWKGRDPVTGEAYIDPNTGLVQRKFLTRGLVDPKDRQHGAAQMSRGFTADHKPLNKELKKVSISEPQQYDLGVSALDLAVAREMGGARYMKYTQKAFGDSTRRVGHAVHNAWIIDKVIRPATAAVVTVDEAMRILHLYGHEAFRMYLYDKAIFTEARVAAAFRGNNPLGRDAVSKGASALSSRAQERIRRLNDMSSRISSAERSFLDQQGIGWVDIPPSDPLFRRHAREWAQQFTNDSGFRAYLEGYEAFGRWWDESSDAAMLRSRAVNMKKGGLPPGKDDIYQGWKTIWEVMSNPAKKAGVLEDWTNAWLTTTREVAEGGRNVPLPEQVFDHFIPVRGAQKMPGGAVNRLTDAFFDRFFMDPVQYRRGFIAEMIRKTEMKRLRQFYATQQKVIVPDSQLDDILRVSGYRSGGGIGLPEAQTHLWQDSGYVPLSYVNRLIERTVAKETENMLYVWNMGSRAGAQSKLVFPFGKPYADMMGFWSREMFKKPILRGYLNNENYLNLQNLTDKLPFNPKTGSLLSRMAATDFYVDRGWIPEEGDTGEGLMPGSESTDLSPIFFLPTEGDDILGSTLPGLGFIPLAFLDKVMDFFGPDPMEDPIAYNQWVQNISEGLPYYEFQQGGFLSRVLGGGTISTGISVGVDAQGYFGGETYFNITSELGDIGREIRRAREVSVILSDPETLEEIAAITDPQLLELYMQGVINDANTAASGSHFLESTTRWVMPARSKWDATGAELQEVWIDAALEFPEFLGVEPQASLETLEGKRQYANDVRSAFFDLEGWERDLLVTMHPQLAVNMVSSWDWTPKAVNVGYASESSVYSSGGSPEDLLRHDYLVDNGFIRPIQPAERARLILGLRSEARDNSIKRVYESVVTDVNRIVWEEIESSPQVMNYFEGVQEEWGEELGTKDAKQVWENWNTVEDFILKRMEATGEVEFDEDTPRSLGLPERYHSWSTQWTGYNKTTSKFGNLVDITLPPDAARIVQGLGLDYEEGMSGADFHRMLADHLAVNDTLAEGMYSTNWNEYTTVRLAPSTSAEAQLQKAIYSPENSPVWQNELSSWVDRVDHIREQWIDEPQGIPTGIRQQITQEFNSIVAGSKDRGTVPWDVIWRRYEGVFGARDWVPIEPLSPFRPDGSRTPTAKSPYIKTVVDGDTLIVEDPTDLGNPYAVRLLGVSAAEYGTQPEEAAADRTRLAEALRQARENGDRIYIVTDPNRFVTNTDRYGRALAWLWIGDKPFYFADEMNPAFTPSGGDR